MTDYLSKEQILEVNDIYIEELSIPEWGGKICVKTLTGDERDKLEAQLVEMSTTGKAKSLRMEHLRSSIAALGICDKDGNSLFTLKDVPALGKKSAAALDRVVLRIQELSAMSPADIEQLTAELKNDQRAASLSA